MTGTSPPSASALDCAVTLASVAAWVRTHAPNAEVNVEVAPGDWRPMVLTEVIELSLERFQAEHGEFE